MQTNPETFLQIDISGANSELLLFSTLFGSSKLKQLATAELCKRTSCSEQAVEQFTDHDLSIL